jgi:hypothetical protein
MCEQVMQFYDAIKNWRRIKPHLADPEFNRILVEDFNKYTYGRWRKRFPAEGRPYPRSFESCDWDWGHRGRQPSYWRYVKHAACHWLVNSNLRLSIRLYGTVKTLCSTLTDKHYSRMPTKRQKRSDAMRQEFSLKTSQQKETWHDER